MLEYMLTGDCRSTFGLAATLRSALSAGIISGVGSAHSIMLPNTGCDDGYVLSLTSTTLERVPYLTEEEVELTAVGL